MRKQRLKKGAVHALVAAHERASRRRAICAINASPLGDGAVRVHEATALDEARPLVDRIDFALIIVDLALSLADDNEDWLRLIEHASAKREVKIVLVAEALTTDVVRKAMRAGACDCVAASELDAGLMSRLLEDEGEGEAAAAAARTGAGASAGMVEAHHTERVQMIGRSAVMLALERSIHKVAATDFPVLVRGPSGAGKELVVRELHRASARRDAPLLAVNCGAIPDSLLESQLFGHKRGAFTGADRDQEGYLEAVGRGTLFLDEIGELPLLLQAKLLRVLETRRYRIVGSTRESVFHGRVIAATHSDLEAGCQSGRFREDLFYRLAVLELEVPPLRERRSDVPLIINRFIEEQPRQFRLSPSALQWLCAYDWPGNVRQLRNLVARITVLSDEDPVSRETVERLLHRRRESNDSLMRFADSILGLDVADKFNVAQDILIARSLERHGGNKSAAARTLGIHRKVLERRLGRQRGGASVSERAQR